MIDRPRRPIFLLSKEEKKEGQKNVEKIHGEEKSREMKYLSRICILLKTDISFFFFFIHTITNKKKTWSIVVNLS